jgi:hypothetical protein
MTLEQDGYFPSKLALGTQFCNRVKEKNLLKININKCRHTVLVAPRRYGKSSLAFNVVREMKSPLASVDLFLAHDDNAVTKRMLTGISQAVSQLLPANKKVLEKLQKVFHKFRISIGAQGFNIDISFEATGRLDAVDQIFSGLEGLANLAKEQNKKLTFFIDEFQDIREASSAKSIQGAIRHVAQETSHVTFIFSGSNRRLLLELFDDKSKPLYMLCDMLALERISSKDYSPHLQKLAIKKWQKNLPPIVFDKIMSLTELHPYYVNLLCNEIWKKSKLPGLDDVFDCWHICYEQHKDRLIAELEKLTIKQQDILKALALFPAIEPTGQSFISASKMPASSINQTIKLLVDKDMVFKVKKIDEAVSQWVVNQVRVLDPLLAYALKKYA